MGQKIRSLWTRYQAWLLVLALAPAASATDFSYAKIRGANCLAGCDYGAVTVCSPFANAHAGILPMLILADPGDFANPWLRAKAVARLLPKVVELMRTQHHVLRVARDEDGNPTVFLGPADRPVRDTDLRVVSVYPQDVDRFVAASNLSDGHKIDAAAVALYWRALIEDELNLLEVFPETRDRSIASHFSLDRSAEGKILLKIFIEVVVLLQIDGKTLESATGADVRADIVRAVANLSREQWGDLVRLAFQIPADFAPVAPVQGTTQE